MQQNPIVMTEGYPRRSRRVAQLPPEYTESWNEENNAMNDDTYTTACATLIGMTLTVVLWTTVLYLFLKQ